MTLYKHVIHATHYFIIHWEPTFDISGIELVYQSPDVLKTQDDCWVFPQVNSDRPRLTQKLNVTSLLGNDITFKYGLTGPYQCDDHNFIFLNVNDCVLQNVCDQIRLSTNDGFCYVKCPATENSFHGTFLASKTAGKEEFSICSFSIID